MTNEYGELYVVVRCGVHSQDVLGLYTLLNDALERQKCAAACEPDDWHRILIGSAVIDKAIDNIDILDQFEPYRHSMVCIGNDCISARHWRHRGKLT